jgi:hypothetical protein
MLNKYLLKKSVDNWIYKNLFKQKNTLITKLQNIILREIQPPLLVAKKNNPKYINPVCKIQLSDEETKKKQKTKLGENIHGFFWLSNEPNFFFF